MTRGQFLKILEIQAACGVRFRSGSDQPASFIRRYHRNPVSLVFAYPAPVLRRQPRSVHPRFLADGD
jgi:hypothetical protein